MSRVSILWFENKQACLTKLLESVGRLCSDSTCQWVWREWHWGRAAFLAYFRRELRLWKRRPRWKTPFSAGREFSFGGLLPSPRSPSRKAILKRPNSKTQGACLGLGQDTQKCVKSSKIVELDELLRDGWKFAILFLVIKTTLKFTLRFSSQTFSHGLLYNYIGVTRDVLTGRPNYFEDLHSRSSRI